MALAGLMRWGKRYAGLDPDDRRELSGSAAA
jgi:hypothetical protein